jgi:O-Antigen ligase
MATAVALVTTWIAYDNGTYGLESRSVLAILVWWALVLVVVFGLVSGEPLPREALLAGGLLSGLALWALASLAWASSAELAFDEFNRVSLYLGVFLLVALGSRRASLGRWADGLAVSVVAIAGIAVVSRLWPGSFPERDFPTFLPGTVTRLSFPLGYWNGLATFVALGVPLLLRLALVARAPALRALSLAPMPLIAACVYLASSRGGVLVALVGTLVLLALTERRWAVAGALAVSVVGAAAAIAVLRAREELVNGPLGTDLVERQGRSGLSLILAACAVTGVAYSIGLRLLRGRAPSSARAGWAVVGVVALVAVAVVAASDPASRIAEFKALPNQEAHVERGGFVEAHLVSGSGSGRWQFWSAAVDAWRDDVLLGEGAGSFASWWAEHGSFAYFVQDAHSLYLETLGELGVVGLLLTVALVATGVVTGVRRTWRIPGESGVTTAALTAVLSGYAVALGVDWMWELTAVSVVGITALALVTGPATQPPEPPRVAEAGHRPRAPRWRFGLVVAGLACVWVLVWAQAVPFLADREVARSQRAARALDLPRAIEAAEAARDIQPWAATPYLQLALVHEQAGALPSARAWIDEAIERDRRDWRLWLVSARIETKLGRLDAALDSLRRAAELNPRSPLFAGVVDDVVGN